MIFELALYSGPDFLIGSPSLFGAGPSRMASHET